MSNPKVLLTIVGPTAIGKTALAIKLANHFDTEIISADSRQFFKEMRIGTAVPTPEELAAAPHHFIQHLSVQDPYSVGDFERDALALLEELYKEHKVVVMAGGSGLYVDAVTRGLDSFPEVSEGVRTALTEQLEHEGIIALQEELLAKDPEYYKQVDLQNPHRLIRALEVIRSSGNSFSSYRNQAPKPRDFQTIKIGLTADRAVIYDRINQRVDLMMQEGLLHEVKGLLSYKELNALQTVGYRELIGHLETDIPLQDAVDAIKQNTRRFAKRQLTWLRKDPQIHWFDYQTPADTIIAEIQAKNDALLKRD
ncbi:tRNA (adenosine(37)-N6)-dimethylallyltransferase MiaA [Gilvibacter sediminis]|uniref:tRNA (adenosine(37)-N6)-dimethylallyltransferase MiaA n=1 Tax=Gilvibacter sediminis TaxID=379071 RepID=UPI00235017A6|nr:tRNA (adenosine(37)-N6)-dimethylallyltransferase MiaA [Gilvibacter sediminis]MDC7997855.1 tRNA (adenosine(37)-N6)-dimethylallyltransferase MiaA [Gilvibacter sediminis]